MALTYKKLQQIDFFLKGNKEHVFTLDSSRTKNSNMPFFLHFAVNKMLLLYTKMSAVHDTGQRQSFTAWFQGIQHPKVQAVLEWDVHNREKTQWKPSAWTLQRPERQQAEVRGQGLTYQDIAGSSAAPSKVTSDHAPTGLPGQLCPAAGQCHGSSVAGTEDSALLRGQSPDGSTTLI